MRTSVRIVVSAAIAVLFVAGALPGADGHTPLSGDDCAAAKPQPFAAPFARGSCPGVRPGAVVRSQKGVCTFAFLFRGSDRRNYMTTAGHCIIPQGGEKRWSADRAPLAFDRNGRAIGKWVYANFRWRGGVFVGPTYDIALIQLSSTVRPNPKMCHFGGPTSMYTKHEATPTLLEFFGNSPAYEDVPARSAVAMDTSDRYYVAAIGPSAQGDSGSGVIDRSGRAVGILTGSNGVGLEESSTAVYYDTVFSRLDAGVARAQKVLRVKLSIRSAAPSPDTSL